MMTGNMRGEKPIDFEAPVANIGIGCQFCYSVAEVHPARANGSYVLAPAAALPYAGTTDPEVRAQGNRELLESPEAIARHKSRRRSYFHGLSLFCATCHKQSLITPVNNYKWFRGFDEYDSWQDSGVSGGSARSFYYPERPLQCQDCHMPEVPSSDAGNDEGLVNSHRFVGSNTALPAFHGYSAQLDEVVRFLREDKLRVDIFALLLPAQGTATAPDSAGSSGAPRVPQPVLVAPADAFDVAVRGGVEIGIEVVVRTANVGHTFTGGTSDSNMAWLEVTVLDADGQPVLMSGGMDEQRYVDPESHFYRGLFLDEAGQEVSKRNGWDRRTPVYVHAIPPGSGDTVHFRFEVPDGDVSGPLQVRARLNYRKHKQSYNRWVFGAVPRAEQPPGSMSTPAVDTRTWDYDDSLVPDLPTVIMAEAELTIGVLASDLAADVRVDGAVLTGDLAQGPQRLSTDSEQWMRFNDYGIGLLRQRDFRGALGVFRHLQALRPDYADAFINEARVHLEEGNLAVFSK